MHTATIVKALSTSGLPVLTLCGAVAIRLPDRFAFQFHVMALSILRLGSGRAPRQFSSAAVIARNTRAVPSYEMAPEPIVFN
jgi:hypothetical protein